MKAIPEYPHRGLKTIPALLALAGAFGLAACGDEIEPGGAGIDGTAISTPAPAQTASAYRLTGQGKVLVADDGTRIAIKPKAVIGYIDNAIANDKTIDLSGWAAPADLSRPADAVVATVGKRSTSIEPSGDRPDLVDGYDKPGLAKAGFVISVPKAALDCSAPSQGLETFGVVGDTASPLKWLADVPQRIAAAC